MEQLASSHDVIGEVRGMGAMIAMEIIAPADRSPDAALTQRLLDRARKLGLLAIKCGIDRNVIRCLVPLVADNETIDEAMEILRRAFSDVLAD